MINILFSQYNFYERWARDSIKKYIHSNSKIVVIPFAFSKNLIGDTIEWQKAYNENFGKYYKQIVDPFLKLGIDKKNITFINYFEDTEDMMKAKIESNDVVFLTGGLPDMAVKHVLEKGLHEYISKCKVVIGVSAGALMQLENYYISPDKDYPQFMYFNGLGLIKKNLYIEVHYSESNLEKDCIKRVLNEKTDIVYAIKDTGGIILENNILTLLGDVEVIKR